jgi:pilus assembly protein CpaC
MGLAGLLDDNLRELVTKFPGLGSVPVLGALFRSQQYQKGQTELVILVTPHLAKPVVPGSVTLPTDKFVEPTDSEFFLLGRTEGSGRPASGHQVN